jgi:branched-chain amino acid transport system permease protein
MDKTALMNDTEMMQDLLSGERPAIAGAGPHPMRRRLWVSLGIMLIFVMLPTAAAYFSEPFYVTLVSRILIFALAAVGLNLVLGYGAMVSLGHALYIGIGAYAVGILSFYGISNGWLHLGAALGVGLIAAVLIGLVCLRTSGVGFIMITLAFAQMFYFLVVGLKTFGGDDGMPIPVRSDFGIVDLNDNVVLYYVAVGILGAVIYLFHRLIHSRFGMVLRGSKMNTLRMEALGFPVLRYRLTAYVISALVCVLAGVLLANLTRFVSPSYMQWSVSGDLIVMVVLGGIGSLMGPVVGTAVWLILEELLSSMSFGLPWGLDEVIHSHWLGAMGLFVIFVTVALKRGIYGLLISDKEHSQ